MRLIDVQENAINNFLLTDARTHIYFFEYWHRRCGVHMANKYGRAVSEEIGCQLFAIYTKITRKYSI